MMSCYSLLMRMRGRNIASLRAAVNANVGGQMSVAYIDLRQSEKRVQVYVCIADIDYN